MYAKNINTILIHIFLLLQEDDLEVRSNDGSSELKNIHFSSLDGLSSVGNLSDPRLISKIEQLLELNMQVSQYSSK